MVAYKVISELLKKEQKVGGKGAGDKLMQISTTAETAPGDLNYKLSAPVRPR